MIAAAPLTVEAFHQWAELQPASYELVHGEVREKPVAHFGHQNVNANITRVLVQYLLGNPIGKAFPETLFDLTPEDSRQPDNAVMLNDRCRGIPSHAYPKGAPDIAIEVVSSESAAELEEKVGLYLGNGSKSVWAVYPRHRTVWVSRPGGVTIRLNESDFLEEPGILPGFRVQVKDLFEGLAES